jgi:hypothetical protein
MGSWNSHACRSWHWKSASKTRPSMAGMRHDRSLRRHVLAHNAVVAYLVVHNRWFTAAAETTPLRSNQR